MSGGEKVVCKVCGVQKKRMADKVCTECGTIYLEKRNAKMPSKWLFTSLLILLLPIGITLGYFYEKKQNSPEKLAEELVHYIELGVTGSPGIQELVNYGDMDKLSNTRYMQNLLETLDGEKDIQKEVTYNLLKQGKALQEGNKTNANVFEIKPAEKKKWLFFSFTKYEAVLKPIDILIHIPDEIQLEVNGEPVKSSGDNPTTIHLPATGSHRFLARYNENMTKWDLSLWKNEKDSITKFQEQLNDNIDNFIKSNTMVEMPASLNDNLVRDNKEDVYTDTEVNDLILKFREEHKMINNNLQNYKKAVIFSEESKPYTKYIDQNGIIRKIIVEDFSIESGVTEYYFGENSKLLFAAQAGKRIEERHYFYNDKMIMLISKEHGAMNFEDGQQDRGYLIGEKLFLDIVDSVLKMVNSDK